MLLELVKTAGHQMAVSKVREAACWTALVSVTIGLSIPTTISQTH